MLCSVAGHDSHLVPNDAAHFPVGSDPVVRQMLLKLEFHRSSPPDMQSGVRDFELPPKPDIRHAPDQPVDESDRPKRPERGEYDDDSVVATQDHIIDWWAHARAVIQDLEDAEFEDWLQSHGYTEYVSIMQGTMPTSGRSASLSGQTKSGSGYRNVYGDFELLISENCVMQTQPRLFDSSDVARNIPPLIVCKPTPRMDLSGLEQYSDMSEQ